MNQLLITDKDKGKITILSGEGECGTREAYTGKHTTRALKLRLAKERCHGDRWAKAEYHAKGYTTDSEVYDPEMLDI